MPSGQQADMSRQIVATETCPTGHEDIPVGQAMLNFEFSLREYRVNNSRFISLLWKLPKEIYRMQELSIKLCDR